MARDHDVGPECCLVDGQMSVMQEDAQPGYDLQGGQREYLVVIAITCHHMAGCNLRELWHD